MWRRILLTIGTATVAVISVWAALYVIGPGVGAPLSAKWNQVEPDEGRLYANAWLVLWAPVHSLDGTITSVTSYEADIGFQRFTVRALNGAIVSVIANFAMQVKSSGPGDGEPVEELTGRRFSGQYRVFSTGPLDHRESDAFLLRADIGSPLQ